MSIAQGLDKFISLSNDLNNSKLEEIIISFENKFEKNSYFFNNDIPLEKLYFIEPTSINSNTREFSNNSLDNRIEEIKSDKPSESNFHIKNEVIELEENEESKINLFLTKKYKKKGRIKLNDTNRKTHNKMDDDNVLTKIQVDFLKFLIAISNDVIEPYFGKYFMPINYSIRKNIKSDHISKLKISSIKDILKMDISPKFQKYGENFNKKVYDFICERANEDENLSWIRDFFNMNYLDLFNEYYYKISKNESYFYFGDKKIKFSEAKPFCYLLEKNKSNPLYQERLIKIAEKCFIDLKKPCPEIFSICKNKN